MPAQRLALITTRRLRLAGRALGLAKLDAGPKAIQVQFIENPPIHPARIIKLLQTDRTVKLAGQDK